MEEEIIEYLKRVGAVSKETGRTFSEIMEATGRNYDTVRTHLKMLLDRRKAEVSDRSKLRQQSHMPYDIEFTKKWRSENHHSITVWLGPVILEEMEKRKQEQELLQALKTIAAKPSQVIGTQINGPAQDVVTGPVIHDSIVSDTLMDQRQDRRSQESKKESPFWRTQVIAPLVVTVVGGILVMVFWEQIKHWF